MHALNASGSGTRGADPPDQRLPVPAGWRFGRRLRADHSEDDWAAIKRCRPGVVAPPHGQALVRLDVGGGVATESGINHLTKRKARPVGRANLCCDRAV